MRNEREEEKKARDKAKRREERAASGTSKSRTPRRDSSSKSRTPFSGFSGHGLKTPPSFRQKDSGSSGTDYGHKPAPKHKVAGCALPGVCS